MSKETKDAKIVKKLSKKSGFSESLIYMALRLGIIGAYDFFNNVKNIKNHDR